ncbi:hypothetical protein KBC79_04250 [Candidatus Woesebacteria bacterium]|nr:hypothetical protein [Candidatus Woesebacteria bacterium]
MRKITTYSLLLVVVAVAAMSFFEWSPLPLYLALFSNPELAHGLGSVGRIVAIVVPLLVVGLAAVRVFQLTAIRIGLMEWLIGIVFLVGGATALLFILGLAGQPLSQVAAMVPQAAGSVQNQVVVTVPAPLMPQQVVVTVNSSSPSVVQSSPRGTVTDAVLGEGVKIIGVPWPNGQSPWANYSRVPPFGTFEVTWWNDDELTFYADPEVWTVSLNAASTYVCDPVLLLAIAHSEHHSYENICNSIDACGVWQFMPGTFPYYNQNIGSTRLDKQAAADAACVMTRYLELDTETDPTSFIKNFCDKTYGNKLVWNEHCGQARYVWGLWQQLRARLP